MNPLTQREKPAVATEQPTLDDFVEHIRYSNPFDVNRLTPTSLTAEDATQVHQRPFDRLLELVRQAPKQPAGIGALLWGEAGIGKSHLLSRLSKWAAGKPPQAIFVYICNLQSEPELLPRSLLRCVVSTLTHSRFRRLHATPLFDIVGAAIRHALGERGPLSWKEIETRYQRMIDELGARSPSQAALVDRLTYNVLFRFFRSAFNAHKGTDDGVAALAVRWLTGDYLAPEEAKALGLPPTPDRDDGVSLVDDEQIKMVLVALAQIASYQGLPFVLCFDQVDNLDIEQFVALARFLHSLLDSSTNLLVVTAGVKGTIFDLKSRRDLPSATWERLALHEIELQRVNPDEARQIVQVRLQPLQEAYMTLDEVRDRVQKDILFPLGEEWARKFLADKIDLRPRDVINWAREGWRRQQEALRAKGGPTWLVEWERGVWDTEEPRELTEQEIRQRIDDKVALKLKEQQQQRALDPNTLPPDADNLTGLVHTLLSHCRKMAGFESLRDVTFIKPPRHGKRPPLSLLLKQKLGADGKEKQTGVLFLVVSDKKSMTGFLRRLTHDPQPAERLFIVTDSRRPLDPAAAGRDYLNQLRKRHGDHFQHVNLTFDQYVELDALQQVIGLARSGDLEIELPGGQSRRVSEQEVIEAYDRLQRYPAHPLLSKLLALPEKPEEGKKPEVPEGVLPDEKDVREFIMGQLGMTMGHSSQELAVKYQHYLQVKQVQLDVAECKKRVEEAAKRLHQENKVNATPHDDYLYLLLR